MLPPTTLVSNELKQNEDEIYYQACINLIAFSSKLQVGRSSETQEKKTFELLRPSRSWIPLGMYGYWYSQNRRDNVVALQQLFYDIVQIDTGQLHQLTLSKEQKTRVQKRCQKITKVQKRFCPSMLKMLAMAAEQISSLWVREKLELPFVDIII